MKKILKGFTLAEVLITLGVIGVVSAMTLPTLTTNVQKQQIAPALGKAINTLQSANNLAIQQGQVRRLNELAEDPAAPAINSYFTEILRPYLKTTPVATSPTYTTINGGDAIEHENSMYQTPDGLYYTVQVSNNNEFQIDVDVNGPKGPNVGGIDLFRLLVRPNGDVVAVGSAEFLRLRGDLELEEGQDAPGCNRGAITDWTYCGGSIVDNNYKVLYY